MGNDRNHIERDSELNNEQKEDEEIKGQNNDGFQQKSDLNSSDREDEKSVESEIESDLEKLQRQLSESESLIGTYKDQLLRLAAEFENYKKRVEADKIEFVKFANEKIIKELLPILDDFERALANTRISSGDQNGIQDEKPFYKGVELIYQKLSKVLKDHGVTPIESIGKEFDVMYHDVLMQIPRKDVKPHTIIEEVERGYMLHDKVIKHAKVIVAAQSNDDSQDVSPKGEMDSSNSSAKN
jgi:molecular chaperone GrpE